jgi:hypothetical protein
MHPRSNRSGRQAIIVAMALLVGSGCIEGHATTDPSGGQLVGPGSVGRDPAAISEITGVVLDEVSWGPIAGARVAVGDLQTTTASDGSYRLGGIQALVVLIVTTKDGYQQHTAAVPLATGSNTFRIFLRRPGS